MFKIVIYTYFFSCHFGSCFVFSFVACVGTCNARTSRSCLNMLISNVFICCLFLFTFICFIFLMVDKRPLY
ncbi:hypothetical protein QVD17_39528 [Tagetes erecta]|uniref:Uncharacterized protein n=1 Tax=Tagetes erecta TaxID=13708 RepID=A0AAD8JQL4_TARER|nr:hypothetical protein QVD17_39528 [Tagetes erecta]